MISVSTLVVTVKHPDGRTEEVQVDSDRVLIGSGAHCEADAAAGERFERPRLSKRQPDRIPTRNWETPVIAIPWSPRK